MHFDILFLVGSGIGNVIETLYAVEYVLSRPEIRVGIYVEKVPQSFISYLKSCYGSIILTEVEGVTCTNLVHSLTVERYLPIPFEDYFYIKPDFHSSGYLSETEQTISVAKALYPHGKSSKTHQRLIARAPSQLNKEEIEQKYVIYPGCSSISPVKRWPYFPQLVQKLGPDQVMIVGGKDDLDFSGSYVYPQWMGAIFPQVVLNQRNLWEFMKKGGMLKAYSHWKEIGSLGNAYIEKFSWEELVWLFRHAKGFVGNDGGLTHLAAASGAKGTVIFGPTSIPKNKPINPDIQVISKPKACSPCQFGVGGVQMTKGYINCPFQVGCLSEISVDTVLKSLI
ncbi:MAG: hypothetical protein K2Q22_02980 [Cytophagales bacterium]|nr:hypothetical protein [Cytophagales bacterium]